MGTAADGDSLAAGQASQQDHRGEHGAKEAGKLRVEGKDYIVKDGDVMHFRFNV